MQHAMALSSGQSMIVAAGNAPYLLTRSGAPSISSKGISLLTAERLPLRLASAFRFSKAALLALTLRARWRSRRRASEEAELRRESARLRAEIEELEQSRPPRVETVEESVSSSDASSYSWELKSEASPEVKRATESSEVTNAPSQEGNESSEDTSGFLSRSFACLFYLIPLCDDLNYALPLSEGRSFLDLGPVVSVLLPVADILAEADGLIIILIMVGVLITFLTRGSQLPRSLLFNIQQAVLFDVVLEYQPVACSAILLFVEADDLCTDGFPEASYLVLLLVTLYCVCSTAVGRIPNAIPLFSVASERLVDICLYCGRMLGLDRGK
mmetsp:Transcript_72627/g.128324  ORF Transcript_72627/g.128324 Transcript_72627/m.128324 type:complete len:328 (+) Transcript_72627:84-1067(+)